MNPIQVNEGENVTRYTGMVVGDCQTSNRCRNNATCVDQHDDNVTSCECSPPWTGIYCQQVLARRFFTRRFHYSSTIAMCYD